MLGLPPTRAILIATGCNEALRPLLNTKPSPLLNIADKPILIHILEHLSQQGIKEYDIVLHHFPEQIEDKLDGGSRWGIQIRYHLAKDDTAPLTSINPMLKELEGEYPILLGVGDCLPNLPNHKPLATQKPIFFNLPQKSWSGWAMLSPEQLRNIPQNTPYSQIPSHFPSSISIEASPWLSARSFCELRESNQNCLDKKHRTINFPTTAKSVEPGIWLSRSVVLEPGVEIIPPIFIGENTTVKSGSRIGPGAIIENHCIIDNDSTIENALICQKSYIGEGLEVANCIIDRNTFIHLELETSLQIHEEFLLGDSEPPSLLQAIINLSERAVALLLFTALLPFFALTAMAAALRKEPKIALPAPEEPVEWRNFDLLTFSMPANHMLAAFKGLPKLINVIKGELSFIGLPPRSAEEAKQLPPEWRQLYLKAKPGVVSLADIQLGNNPTPDDLYASEAYYIACRGPLYDFKLLIKWLFKTVKKQLQ